jgi:CRISPR/Cas system CMR subunit Cmr6 (Cas7 group RAMP superfamily)
MPKIDRFLILALQSSNMDPIRKQKTHSNANLQVDHIEFKAKIHAHMPFYKHFMKTSPIIIQKAKETQMLVFLSIIIICSFFELKHNEDLTIWNHGKTSYARIMTRKTFRHI